MRDQKKHISYSLTDIEQYLQGKLSPAEMHELEKAALQDPFLSDAIEGYESANLEQTKKDLGEIHQRLLLEKLEDPKIIPITSPLNNWWKVAASILLFAAAGTIALYLFNADSAKKETAQRQVLPVKKDTLQQGITQATQPAKTKQKTKAIIAGEQKLQTKELLAIKPVPDSISSNDQALASTLYTADVTRKLVSAEKAQQSVRSMQSTVSPQRDINKLSPPGIVPGDTKNQVTSLGNLTSITVSGSVNPSTSNNALAVMTNASIASGNSLTQPASGNRLGDNFKNQIYTYQGTVLDAKTRKPIPNASISLAKTKQQFLTDSGGNFAFRSYDTVQPVHILSYGFEAKELLATASKPMRIAMQESNQELNEVVVIGYGKTQKKEMMGYASSIPETTPEGGWASFTDWLNKKIIRKKNNPDSLLHGKVTVELTLKNGKVLDAVIIQTFNDSLSPALIKALKNGPRWTSSIISGKKENRTVNFIL